MIDLPGQPFGVRRSLKPLTLGAAILAPLLVASTAGIFVPPAPHHDLARALCPPSSEHWLGCDAYGIPLGMRILAGAWRSLRIATLVTAITMAIGLFVGTVAALAPRWIDGILLLLIDWFLAFPGLLLAILIASIMPHTEATIIFALAATAWAGRARFARVLVQDLARRPHVEAAKANGASGPRIVLRHIWPGLHGQMAIQAALSMGGVIMSEASLSFLGLGGTIDNPSWGRLIAEGRDFLIEAPHLSIIPGIIFVLAVLAFNLCAEGLRNRLDPASNVRVY